jgi:hypothetical protein
MNRAARSRRDVHADGGEEQREKRNAEDAARDRDSHGDARQVRHERAGEESDEDGCDQQRRRGRRTPEPDAGEEEPRHDVVDGGDAGGGDADWCREERRSRRISISSPRRPQIRSAAGFGGRTNAAITPAAT